MANCERAAWWYRPRVQLSWPQHEFRHVWHASNAAYRHLMRDIVVALAQMQQPLRWRVFDVFAADLKRTTNASAGIIFLCADKRQRTHERVVEALKLRIIDVCSHRRGYHARTWTK